MASINRVNFSYPILCDFNDDYVNSSFIGGSTGSLLYEKRKAIIETYTELKNEELRSLLLSNQAKIIVKVYCPSTKFRQIYNIQLGIDRIVIDYKNMNKKVILETYIVANENLINYSNSSFNEDYKGEMFSIDKGSILAIGKEEFIDLEKDDNDLADVGAVIKIKCNNEDEGPMSTEFDGDYLKIYLNKYEFEVYNKYSEYELPIVNSMIIIPGIMDALDKITLDEDETVYDRRWFRALKKKALDLYKIDLTIDYLKNNGSFEIVQKILGYQFTDAMRKIDQDNRGDN